MADQPSPTSSDDDMRPMMSRKTIPPDPPAYVPLPADPIEAAQVERVIAREEETP